MCQAKEAHTLFPGVLLRDSFPRRAPIEQKCSINSKEGLCILQFAKDDSFGDGKTLSSSAISNSCNIWTESHNHVPSPILYVALFFGLFQKIEKWSVQALRF